MASGTPDSCSKTEFMVVAMTAPSGVSRTHPKFCLQVRLGAEPGAYVFQVTLRNQSLPAPTPRRRGRNLLPHYPLRIPIGRTIAYFHRLLASNNQQGQIFTD